MRLFDSPPPPRLLYHTYTRHARPSISSPSLLRTPAAIPWVNQIPDASVFTTSGLDRSTHWYCHAKAAAAKAASGHGDTASVHGDHGNAKSEATGAGGADTVAAGAKHHRRTQARGRAGGRRLSAAAAAARGGHGTVCPDTCEGLAHPHSYLALIFLFFALFLGIMAEYVHYHMIHYR